MYFFFSSFLFSCKFTLHFVAFFAFCFSQVPSHVTMFSPNTHPFSFFSGGKPLIVICITIIRWWLAPSKRQCGFNLRPPNGPTTISPSSSSTPNQPPFHFPIDRISRSREFIIIGERLTKHLWLR